MAIKSKKFSSSMTALRKSNDNLGRTWLWNHFTATGKIKNFAQ